MCLPSLLLLAGTGPDRPSEPTSRPGTAFRMDRLGHVAHGPCLAVAGLRTRAKPGFSAAGFALWFRVGTGKAAGTAPSQDRTHAP